MTLPPDPPAPAAEPGPRFHVRAVGPDTCTLTFEAPPIAGVQFVLPAKLARALSASLAEAADKSESRIVAPDGLVTK